MNLRALQCFVILAEELNFSRAAERLHIAQPALSQQIRLLEERLGTQLVDRARRPLRLTEAGHYLCTEARQILGEGVLLAPEQHVVLDPDVEKGRALARTALAYYLKLQNYTNNWRRLGFTDADLAGDGSDRLVDALVAHGDAQRVAARVTEHLDAGADHVCIQLIAPRGTDPLLGFADLAGHLLP